MEEGLFEQNIGRFVFCVVSFVEAKRFLLCFPKGRGLPGEWSILAKKLHHLGVDLFVGARLPPTPSYFRIVEVGFSSKDGTKGLHVDVARRFIVRWLKQFGSRWGPKMFKTERSN